MRSAPYFRSIREGIDRLYGKNTKPLDRNGDVVSIKEVLDNDELILITKKGITNRQNVKDVHVIGRNTAGVRLISLDKDDKVFPGFQLSQIRFKAGAGP